MGPGTVCPQMPADTFFTVSIPGPVNLGGQPRHVKARKEVVQGLELALCDLA